MNKLLNISVTDPEVPGEATEQESLSDQTVESLAAVLRVLADPTRIKLIEVLEARGRVTAGALAGAVPGTRQSVSHHLGILHQAGVVAREDDGRRVRYELRDWTGAWVLRQLGSGLVGEPRR